MPGRWKRVDEPLWRETIDGDCVRFRLNTAATETIEQHCPNRNVDLAFVRQMTFAQLELFILVSVLADGHFDPSGGAVIAQSDPGRLAAIEYACVLAGRRLRRYSEPPTGYGTNDRHCLHIGVSGPIVDFQHGGINEATYTGTVWCPTTSNGTWFARRNGTFFFTGNSITDEERRITVQPDLEMMCWALTRLILVPRLERRRSGVRNSDIPNYRVWFDLSSSAIRANQTEDSRQLHDRNAIGEAALRRIHNLRDSDAPNPAERIRNVGWKMGLPRLALYEIDGADDIPDDWLVTTKSGPNPDSPAGEAPAGPGKGQPGSPDDQDSDTPKANRPA